METLNAPTHPQVLFAGFNHDDPRLHAMQQLVGASRVLDTFTDTSQIRPRDWDALVIEGSLEAFNVASHWQILAFASPLDDLGTWDATAYGGAHVVREFDQHSPTLYPVNERLPDGPAGALFKDETLRRLEETTPPVPRLKGLTTSTDDPSHTTPGFYGRQSRPGSRPVLLDADGFFVAGEFPLSSTMRADRSRHEAWCWYLPHPSDHPEIWLAYLLSVWHERDPQRFPERQSWRARPEWMSGEELAATEERERIEVAHAEAVRAFQQRRIEADALVASAAAAAESGTRRLLTEQGNALVEAVTAALIELGFAVVDIDAQRGEGEAKAEDLDITDPDQPTTTVIAEVKGYKRGAKSSDLQQITQHAKRYRQREGSDPDRSWYVVNQFRHDDPSARPALLGGAEENVSVFAQDNGLVIDTRDLWRLLREVQRGILDVSDIRAHLMSSTGLLDCSELLKTDNESDPE